MIGRLNVKPIPHQILPLYGAGILYCMFTYRHFKFKIIFDIYCSCSKTQIIVNAFV